jgi:hypothetical protein
MDTPRLRASMPTDMLLAYARTAAERRSELVELLVYGELVELLVYGRTAAESLDANRAAA